MIMKKNNSKLKLSQKNLSPNSKIALKDKKILKELRNTVVFYKDPTEPVGLDDWEALK